MLGKHYFVKFSTFMNCKNSLEKHTNNFFKYMYIFTAPTISSVCILLHLFIFSGGYATVVKQ